MKLDNLIASLLELQEELRDSGVDTSETDVLAGTQPHYPLTNVVLGAVSGEDIIEHANPMSDASRRAVWMATDSVGSSSVHSPYAPKALWEAIR